ncbi:MAG: class I SAM-dependent methyltransferase [Candidatus Promineifilaceae bacterium]
MNRPDSESTAQDEVRRQFGENAAAYAYAKVESVDRLIELVSPQAHWQILDVATGAGQTAVAFAPFVKRVTATDITPQMLEQAEKLREQRSLENVVLETADAVDLPYPDNSFNLVTCRIAPHHFPDIACFVAESARVLLPAGLLAVVDNIVPPGPVGDYVNGFEKLRDPSHRRCLSLEKWLEIFAAAGLDVEQQETLAKRRDFDVWAQRHDAHTQAYLRALLTEAGPGPSIFLKPEEEDGSLSFRLLEGIIVGRKAT